MNKYYFAKKGCSHYTQKRSMLEVDEKGHVEFHRGVTDDRFKFVDDELVCTTESGGLEYNITGPLNKDEINFLLNKHLVTGWGDFTQSTTRRPVNIRGR